MEKDSRYTITCEYHGAPQCGYVLRYLDKWVSVHATRAEAVVARAEAMAYDQHALSEWARECAYYDTPEAVQ